MSATNKTPTLTTEQANGLLTILQTNLEREATDHAKELLRLNAIRETAEEVLEMAEEAQRLRGKLLEFACDPEGVVNRKTLEWLYA